MFVSMFRCFDVSLSLSLLSLSLFDPASSAYLAADDEYLQAWKWVAYGSALMTVVLLVVIAAMKSKIKIAIGIVKETSKAVHDMKSLMVYPLVTTTLLICLMLW